MKKFPLPRRGRGRVGVEIGFFHTFPFQRGNVKSFPQTSQRLTSPLKREDGRDFREGRFKGRKSYEKRRMKESGEISGNLLSGRRKSIMIPGGLP